MRNMVLELLQFPFRQRQRRAHHERPSVTQEQFAAELGGDAWETQAAARLWSILREQAMIDDFRPLPDDSFSRLYALADEDLDEDVIAELFRRIGLALPSAAVVQATGRIDTPRELMGLVRAARSESDDP